MVYRGPFVNIDGDGTGESGLMNLHWCFLDEMDMSVFKTSAHDNLGRSCTFLYGPSTCWFSLGSRARAVADDKIWSATSPKF